MKKTIVSFVVSVCIVFSLVGAERMVFAPKPAEQELSMFYRMKASLLATDSPLIHRQVRPIIKAICFDREGESGLRLLNEEGVREVIRQIDSVNRAMKSPEERAAFLEFSFELMEDVLTLLAQFMQAPTPEASLLSLVENFCTVYRHLLEVSIANHGLRTVSFIKNKEVLSCGQKIESLILMLKSNSLSDDFNRSCMPFLESLRLKNFYLDRS